MLAIAEQGSGNAATPADRRSGASRQRLMMRVVKLVCGSGEYPCVMLDVSDSGAKLRLFEGHPPENYAFVELPNGELYAAERRWTKDDTAGFRFTSSVDVADFIADSGPHSRRPVRLRTQHPVEFVAEGNRGHAVLVNLSARGACIEAGRKLPVGSPLKLELGEWPARFAHVCWRKDYRHGLAFQDAMPLGDFARLAKEIQPFDAIAGESTLRPIVA